MATAPTMKDEDEKVTPEDRARMQAEVDRQRREAAEAKAYEKSDMMSGEKAPGKKKGGTVKMAKGGYVKAADGIAQRGKTRGRMV